MSTCRKHTLASQGKVGGKEEEILRSCAIFLQTHGWGTARPPALPNMKLCEQWV